MKTLSELIQSEGFQNFRSDKLGNDLFINDPDRASRIYDSASEGVDGSTHEENIEDMREYLNTLSVYDPEFDENINHFDLSQNQYDSINQEIDDCINWHDKNGSLYEVCG